MKFLGLGDNVIDRYRNLNKMFPGGNAVNVAAHIAKLGYDAAYLGKIADDSGGALIQSALNDLKVDLSRCEIVKNSTSKYCDVDVFDGERSFIGVDLGTNWAGTLTLNDELIHYITKFDVIHCSCNAKMEEEIIKLKDCHSIISFDFGEKPKYRDDEYLNKICPYIDFALFSINDLTIDQSSSFMKHVYQLGVDYVLVTRGSEGQVLYNGKEFFMGDVEYVEPVDTMGAGDSFLSAFLVSFYESGWCKHKDMEVNAIRRALKDGAQYSASNCLLEGGFGYKQAI
ncbi:MAG: PfkB family carbohydrate kinase [Erysipelotrichaceae bacterium]